jgi:hypothetical protein
LVYAGFPVYSGMGLNKFHCITENAQVVNKKEEKLKAMNNYQQTIL